MYLLSIIFYLILFFQVRAISLNILSEDEVRNFRIIDSAIKHDGSDANIRIITDGKNNYILKQINDSSLDEQFLLINDLIASTIGIEAGIAVNAVSLIPYDVGSGLKKYPDRAATIHTYIPGRDLEHELPDFLPEDFNIQQRVINPNSEWQKKYPLSEHRQGLARGVLESMYCHEQLAPIVAFDMFIGNSDRSLPNLFYDNKTYSFYGIDHAAAFDKQLSIIACYRIKELMQTHYFKNLSAQQRKGLKLFRNFLVQLQKNNDPKDITKTMTGLVSYLGQYAENNNQLLGRIEYHSRIMKKNYIDSFELISLLNQLICD